MVDLNKCFFIIPTPQNMKKIHYFDLLNKYFSLICIKFGAQIQAIIFFVFKYKEIRLNCPFYS